MFADTIIKSNNVYTGLTEFPIPACVAINGNKISVIIKGIDPGDYAGPDTKVLDYGDCLIMPGICDAHLNFEDGALSDSKYYLTELDQGKSEEECALIIKKYIDNNPDVEKIIGQGWLTAFWGNAPNPTCKSLDAVSPDKPVYMTSADGHSLWINSKAMEVIELDKYLDDPDLKDYIEKDENGKPTGVLHEDAGFVIAGKEVHGQSFELRKEIQLDCIKKMNALGITTINDVSGFVQHVRWDTIEALEKEGLLTMRVQISEGLGMGDEDKLDSAIALREKYHSPMFQINNIMGLVDGATSIYTGLLREPYSDNPETCGDAMDTYENFERRVIEANAAGFGVRLHAIGDLAVKWALDAFEASAMVNDLTNIRNAVEHVETIDPSDVPRFRALNVVASMQPAHVPLEMDDKFFKVGYERCMTEWAFRTLQEAGAILAFGTDFPVAHYNPWEGIYYAVTRNGYNHKPTTINPNEKISLSDTLRAYTWGGAYVENRDHELGTLQPGKLADIIVLDRNLFDIDVEEIPETQVMLTMLDGKIIYQNS